MPRKVRVLDHVDNLANHHNACRDFRPRHTDKDCQQGEIERQLEPGLDKGNAGSGYDVKLHCGVMQFVKPPEQRNLMQQPVRDIVAQIEQDVESKDGQNSISIYVHRNQAGELYPPLQPSDSQKDHPGYRDELSKKDPVIPKRQPPEKEENTVCPAGGAAGKDQAFQS